MSTSIAERNRSFIEEAFAAWARGDGDIFALLADDVVWQIAGNDPEVARTYKSKQALLEATSFPLRRRLSGPLEPSVRRTWVDGDDVLVLWDGTAPAHDGSQYRNTYMWILTIHERCIVAVTAFLDNETFRLFLNKPAP